MKLPACLSLLSLFTAFLAVSGQALEQWPLHNDGLNTVVEWDHYSFLINGERLFIFSGEMHYWRLPVPEMWIDILVKIKAAGFNTVSLYAHWGYHSAKDGSLDFETGAHNFTGIFDIAKEIGLYVLVRPGPYINAEASAGGFPGWVTTGAFGSLRNNDTRYTQAWTPYFEKISEIVAEHQVTRGGNVFIYQIENEYGEQWIDPDTKVPNDTAISYMELLENSARASGIDIPLIANNPNLFSKSWSQDYSVGVGGNVDVYGLDHYPSCWSCNLLECVSVNGLLPAFTVYDYFTNFQQVAPTQPSFLAEFQGGSYNPWAGPQGGCANNTGATWANLFYRHNVDQKVTAMNLYMLFGGTSWGQLPAPIVGTSYDYSAPISESRVIGDKYAETKLLGLFLRVARGLTMVERIGNNTEYASDPAILTTELRNPVTNGAFYVTRHADSTSTNLDTFSLSVTTSRGNMTIPKFGNDIALNGLQSKILVTDFPIGSQSLLYSTAEILTLSIQDGNPTVVFWVPTGESGEFFLEGAHSGSVLKCDGCSSVEFNFAEGGIVASFTQSEGMTVFMFDNGVRAVIVDRTAGYNFWAPTLSSDPFSPENETVLVQGPYLVRSATVLGNTVALTGDWNDTTTFDVFAPESVSAVTFNGQEVQVTRTNYGSLVGNLAASVHTIDSIAALLPALTNWKVNDGMPEREASYDDSRWIDANHESTPNPSQPETFPVLYSDEYGFHTGNLLWRGRFSGDTATGVYLRVIGGTSFGWSAFLNGAYIGSWLGSTALNIANLTLSFDNATLTTGENVLFVIQDHMGKDETTGALDPRGILNATLLGGTFTSWKVAGKAGGEANIDPVRGTYAEGGLHAERLGWHLPGFDDSDWEQGTPDEGLIEAGANFYRTVVPLNIPSGIDVSLGFILNAPTGSNLRAQLYVNGYMFGKFVPQIGHQIVFPVFPGILDYTGDNTIGLSIWAQDAAGGQVSVEWTVLGVFESAFSPLFDAADLRPVWTDRSQFA